MERWTDCVAVVTGASSGIGAAIVKDLLKAKENLNVVGLARRLERMEEYERELPVDQRKRFYPLQCNVSSKESVDGAFDLAIEKLKRVDILVNNTGIFVTVQLNTIDASIPQQVLQTYVMGVFYCTQRAFKSIKERKFDGHVVIVNSNLGHKIPSIGDQPPFMNMYGPRKFAVTAMTELYRVSPGLTATEIVPEEYRTGKYPIMQPEPVSQCVMFTLSTPPHVQIHEILVEPNGAR